MLFGASAMRQLVLDGCDDAHLVIGPALEFDTSRLAGARPFAVGGDNEARSHGVSIIGRDSRQSGVEFAACDGGTSSEGDVRRLKNTVEELTIEMAIFDHIGGWAMMRFGLAEIQKSRSRIRTRPPIGHDDF